MTHAVTAADVRALCKIHETTKDTKENEGNLSDYSLRGPSCPSWFIYLQSPKRHHKNPLDANYQRNLLALTGVPTMVLVWVTKLFSSVPMKKPLAR
jgi:hypothetical protein